MQAWRRRLAAGCSTKKWDEGEASERSGGSGTLPTGTGARDAHSVPVEGTDGQSRPVRGHHTGDGGGVHGRADRGAAQGASELPGGNGTAAARPQPPRVRGGRRAGERAAAGGAATA